MSDWLLALGIVVFVYTYVILFFHALEYQNPWLLGVIVSLPILGMSTVAIHQMIVTVITNGAIK